MIIDWEQLSGQAIAADKIGIPTIRKIINKNDRNSPLKSLILLFLNNFYFIRVRRRDRVDLAI